LHFLPLFRGQFAQQLGILHREASIGDVPVVFAEAFGLEFEDH
jgi:hypothetical protein